jgi:methyl-accepting chemotaxis protein
MKYKMILMAAMAATLLLAGCEKAKEAAEASKEAVSDVATGAKDMAAKAGESAGNVAESAKDIAAKAGDVAGEVAEGAKEIAGQAGEAVSGAVNEAVDDAKEMATAAGDTAAGAMDSAKEAVAAGAAAVAAAEEIPATQEGFDAALTTAKDLQAQAAAAGAEWRDTGKLIESAQEAAGKGDFAKAVSLAGEAKMQAEMAIKQAEANKNAGPRF